MNDKCSVYDDAINIVAFCNNMPWAIHPLDRLIESYLTKFSHDVVVVASVDGHNKTTHVKRTILEASVKRKDVRIISINFSGMLHDDLNKFMVQTFIYW